MLYAFGVVKTSGLPTRIIEQFFANDRPLFALAEPPGVILSKIALVQSTFYVLLTGLPAIILLLFGETATLELFFNTESYNFTTYKGWFISISLLLNSISVGIVVAVVAERVRRCLDYSFTCIFIHGLLCLTVGRGSSSFPWWLANLMFLLLCNLTAESICIQREMGMVDFSAENV